MFFAKEFGCGSRSSFMKNSEKFNFKFLGPNSAKERQRAQRAPINTKQDQKWEMTV